MAPIDFVAPGLGASLAAPIKTTWFGAVPRLFAGGLPVTAVNLALRDRVSHGTTRVSIRSYSYSASLFLSFLASRRRALLEATNADFVAFTSALLGQPYRDADGRTVPCAPSSSSSGATSHGSPTFDRWTILDN